MAELPLLGEPLSIELANTVVAGSEGEIDLLAGPGACAAWIRAHLDELPAGALEQQPSAARLRALRDAVCALLAAAIDSRPAPPAALDELNAAASLAAPTPALVWPGSRAPAVELVSGERVADATLATIARSAIELLGGPDRERLRRCEHSDCVLTFVATNPRRRWCSASGCGNRARVARHYRRHRLTRVG